MAQDARIIMEKSNHTHNAPKSFITEHKYTLIPVNEHKANMFDVYKIHVQRQSMYQQEIYINRGITMNHHYNAAQGKSTIFVSPNYAITTALQILTTLKTFQHIKLSIADQEKGVIIGFVKK